MKGLGVFDDLKLRLSYGTVGNQGEVLIDTMVCSYTISNRMEVH